MSDAVQISSGSTLNQSQQGALSKTTQASQGPETTAQAGNAAEKGENKGQGKDFPALFKSMMQITPDDPAQAGMLMSPLVDTTALTKTKGKTASDNTSPDANTAAAASLPMIAADAGKGLPQLAWSGYVGVANNGEATALALQGDQDGVINSQAVAGKDLSSAILKAQEQVAQAQLQQGKPVANDGSDFTALMVKENLPALHMEQKLLADNLVTPQHQTLTANSPGATQHTAINDLSALAVGTAVTRSADNTMQQISVPVQNPQWSQEVGDRVQWMVGQKLNQADIHLNPPELGALQVHIKMHGDQASVSFSSPHALVRDALDAAMPRLREMMHDAGLTLGDVNVSGQAFAQQQPRDSGAQQGQGGRFSGSGHADESQTVVATSAVKHLRPNGMLDVYA